MPAATAEKAAAHPWPTLGTSSVSAAGPCPCHPCPSVAFAADADDIAAAVAGLQVLGHWRAGHTAAAFLGLELRASLINQWPMSHCEIELDQLLEHSEVQHARVQFEPHK